MDRAAENGSDDVVCYFSVTANALDFLKFLCKQILVCAVTHLLHLSLYVQLTLFSVCSSEDIKVTTSALDESFSQFVGVLGIVPEFLLK